MTIAAIWHLCGIGPIELFSGKIVDDYGPWSYAIQKKFKTDVPMYVTEQQRVAYALSRMKSPLFDKIAAWVAENSDTIMMLRLFDKTKHWIKVHLQATKAKQELIIIAMKNTESVSKYYHRIFKLWMRTKTSTNKKIVKFTRLLKPSISTPLLNRKFTSIRAVLDKTQNIKDAQKEITYTFPRQDNRQQQQSFLKFSCEFNSRGSVTSGGSATSGGLEGKDRKPTASKLAGWFGMWYNPDLKPKKLENDDKTMLSRQGHCWTYYDSSHCESNKCCPEFKKRLNLVTV